MRTRLNHLTALLAAGAAAAVIALAPAGTSASSQGSTSGGAAARTDTTQPQQSCVTLGGSQNECQSPGNAQIYDAPPQVDFYPYAGGGT